MTSLLPEEGEYLTTGWEDDVEPGDSIVRQAVLAHVSWARALTNAARSDFARKAPAGAPAAAAGRPRCSTGPSSPARRATGRTP